MDIIFNSAANVFVPINILFIILGVTAGIIFGAMPGLTATVGVALMLPLTFGLDPATGLLLLVGVYCGAIFGGSIAAILINTPGTPAAAATVIDGYALTKKGKGSEALGMAVIASVTGGIFSALVLLFIAPQVAKIAYQFGAAEYFALAFFGLTMIVNLSDGVLIKGFIMGILGMLIATVGMDPVSGVPRFTFDNYNLMGGVELIPALVGLFAISEFVRRSQIAHQKTDKHNRSASTRLPFTKAFKYKKTLLKSSIIGTFIGSTPGAGGDVGAFMAYNEAKRASSNKNKFGKGSLEGVAAAESGNNGVTGATLIPLLTIGIPGDAVAAVMLGALLMQGISPGPEIFVNHADVMYTLMIGLIVVNIVMFFIGIFAIKLFIKITAVPMNLIIPILLAITFVGAYAVNNSVFDVRVMLLFGLIGVILPRYGFPVTPMLLGMILGPIAERALRQSLIISDGSWLIFINRPIAFVFILLAIVSLVVPVVQKYLKYRRENA